jgi:hypothetical protein
MAMANVNPREGMAVRFNSFSPSFPLFKAADSAGTADIATEVVRDGRILNRGTAKVE